jgi:NADH-quinone oxidoreductase subunit G
VVSPHMTVEEAYLLCRLIREIDAEAPLVLGPVPVVGHDETFPGGFTISAERCPNRRGVEEILKHFSGGLTTFDEFLPELARGEIRGVWVSGGYKSDWIDEETAEKFSGLDLLVVQDLFPSPLSDRATYRLPAAAFAERDGSYVNRGDRLQSAPWAIRPPSGVRVEGSLLWELIGLEGLFDAPRVLKKVAREIAYFQVAADEVPDVGIDLKANLLAAADVSEDKGVAT